MPEFVAILLTNMFPRATQNGSVKSDMKKHENKMTETATLKKEKMTDI